MVIDPKEGGGHTLLESSYLLKCQDNMPWRGRKDSGSASVLPCDAIFSVIIFLY